MKRIYRVGQISGIEIRLHLSAIVTLAIISLLAVHGGAPLLLLAVAVLTLMLCHELGHASIARHLGYAVHAIELSPLHGQCWCDEPRTRHHESLIAWGGVSAQATVLLFAAALSSQLSSDIPNLLNLALFVFTYWNAILIIFNLAPIRGLDGYTAWAVFRAARRP